VDELYVAARRVLLDGLDALGTHRAAVILVGAQAIYLRVGESDLSVAPYTTDADLAIDPARLAEIPPLEQALQAAAFRLDPANIGIWIRTTTLTTGSVNVSVDLLLPEAVSTNPKSRAAALVGHGRRAVRNVAGLDGALVDQDLIRIGSFEPGDTRAFDLMVAGPAAMLAAKLRKIEDRAGSLRSSDKDALDVLRLLRGTTTVELATRYRLILADARSTTAAEKARALLRSQFVARDGVGAAMIARSVGVLADPVELAASARVLAQDLLDMLGS
jgi:hypothetical protein